MKPEKGIYQLCRQSEDFDGKAPQKDSQSKWQWLPTKLMLEPQLQPQGHGTDAK